MIPGRVRLCTKSLRAVTYKDISDEDTVKLSLFEELSEFDPVTDVVKVP
jgi:hypothetical protein